MNFFILGPSRAVCVPFLSALLLALVLPASAQVQNVVVTTSGDDAGSASNCTAQPTASVGSDAACSLRDALAFAALSTASSINVSFDSSVFSNGNSVAANTISLKAGALQIPANTSINGPTAGSGATQSNTVTVSGSNASTVFSVASGVTAVQLSNLDIVQGSSTQGGGINNAGALSVNRCTLSGNAASSSTSGVATGGGGIFNSGTLTLSNSTISGNSAAAVGAAALGGGIQSNGKLTLLNSTVSGNSVTAEGQGTGGGIYTTNVPGSSMELISSTVSANTADGEGGGIFAFGPQQTQASVPQNRTLQTLGDSITYGYASTGCPAPYSDPTTLADATCWAGLVANDLGYVLSDTGVSNSGAGDVSLIQIYNSPRQAGSDLGQFVPGDSTISTFLIGEVDGGSIEGEKVPYFNGTRNVTEWQMEHEDVVAFMLTPHKVPVNSSACSASAGWTASSLWMAGGLQSTANGATITCPIVGSTAYVSVMAQVGNLSSIAIAVDGGAPTAYTYALSSASALGNTTTGMLFRIPNLPGKGGSPLTASHTVTITANVSGSSPVFLNWVDGNGSEQAGALGPVVFTLAPYDTVNRSETDGALPTIRPFLAQEEADLRSDGLNEVVGDLSIPCTAVPVTNPAVFLCDTFDGVHPNNAGHALIAGYVEQLIQNYVAIGNSIVAGNAAPLAQDTNEIFTDNGGNQIGVANVGLAPLASYGGATQTMVPLPGSPALCDGVSAKLNGLSTDQRGFPRTTTYGSTTCVDSGAVETSYALAFSTQPPATASFKIPISPAPVVALTESGAPATGASNSISLTDNNGLLTGTTKESLASGSAVFSDLVLSSATTSDKLLATSTLTPSLNLTAQSGPFNATQASPTVSVVPASSSVTILQALSTVATVIGGTDGPVPTGSVTLTGGGYTSAAATLSSGSATIVIPAGSLALGADTLKANYSGDSTYVAASGSAPPVSVAKAASAVAGTASPATITAAQAVSVKVVVSGSGSAPTGTVTLMSGGYTSAPTAISNGAATIVIPGGSLAGGTDTLAITYSGDRTYLASSASLVLKVQNFTLSGSAVTLTPGATSGNTSTISITPVGGFTGSVALRAAITASPADATDAPTVSFGATTPAVISSSAGGSATLTVTTTASSSTTCSAVNSSPTHSPWYVGGGTVIALACLIWLPARGRGKSWFAMSLLLVTLVGTVLSCGVSGNSTKTKCSGPATPGTTAGSYAITVTATSGALTVTDTVKVDVE